MFLCCAIAPFGFLSFPFFPMTGVICHALTMRHRFHFREYGYCRHEKEEKVPRRCWFIVGSLLTSNTSLLFLLASFPLKAPISMSRINAFFTSCNTCRWFFYRPFSRLPTTHPTPATCSFRHYRILFIARCRVNFKISRSRAGLPSNAASNRWYYKDITRRLPLLYAIIARQMVIMTAYLPRCFSASFLPLPAIAHAVSAMRL